MTIQGHQLNRVECCSNVLLLVFDHTLGWRTDRLISFATIALSTLIHPLCFSEHCQRWKRSPSGRRACARNAKQRSGCWDESYEHIRFWIKPRRWSTETVFLCFRQYCQNCDFHFPFPFAGALAIASVLLYPKTLGGCAVFSGSVPLRKSFAERVSPEARKVTTT